MSIEEAVVLHEYDAATGFDRQYSSISRYWKKLPKIAINAFIEQLVDAYCALSGFLGFSDGAFEPCDV